MNRVKKSYKNIPAGIFFLLTGLLYLLLLGFPSMAYPLAGILRLCVIILPIALGILAFCRVHGWAMAVLLGLNGLCMGLSIFVERMYLGDFNALADLCRIPAYLLLMMFSLLTLAKQPGSNPIKYMWYLPVLISCAGDWIFYMQMDYLQYLDLTAMWIAADMIHCLGFLMLGLWLSDCRKEKIVAKPNMPDPDLAFFS